MSDTPVQAVMSATFRSATSDLKPHGHELPLTQGFEEVRIIYGRGQSCGDSALPFERFTVRRESDGAELFSEDIADCALGECSFSAHSESSGATLPDASRATLVFTLYSWERDQCFENRCIAVFRSEAQARDFFDWLSTHGRNEHARKPHSDDSQDSGVPMLAPFLGVAVCVLGVLALATFFEIGPNNVLRWEHSVISSAPVSPEAVLHAGQNAVLAQSAICGGNAEDEHQLLTLYRRGNADNAQMSAFYMHMMANGALPLDPNEHVQAIENRDDLVRVQPIWPFGTNTTCWILGTDKHLFNRIE